MSDRDPFSGSPTDLGSDPAGVPPEGGHGPAGSASGPAADSSSEAADPQNPRSAEDPGAREAGRGEPGAESGSVGGSGEGGAGDVDPLSAAEQERDEYRDALVRLQADFENYKKRMLKQQTEHLERAAASLVEKLLPVLDTADLALAHGGGEDVKQLIGSLLGALEKEGLERIAGEGAPFDPTLHDAVAHEPGDGDDGEQVVVEVFRAGYRWKGRVLRPAMVKVRG